MYCLELVTHCDWLICMSLKTVNLWIISPLFFPLTMHFFFFFNFFYFWLCWVFVSVRGLSPVAASGGHSSSRCVGLSLSRPLSLRSTGSRRAGWAVVAHGPSRSVACGILPDQGSKPCPPHRQADSQPLRHQGSPCISLKKKKKSWVAFSVVFQKSRVSGFCWLHQHGVVSHIPLSSEFPGN